ncbi:hypothetical protein IPA_02390 [Ignicoccus pacificus DSM 13166]|uniref:Uncharacterized protein n=1 Tax=Ignicoccus pacificus DSM 13166 TaxID=940294 RepID=A0A977KAP8_9CREN|nr:hypothetical protein IPA_02390 [Ignicoccus pacificus DSM 13166]
MSFLHELIENSEVTIVLFKNDDEISIKIGCPNTDNGNTNARIRDIISIENCQYNQVNTIKEILKKLLLPRNGIIKVKDINGHEVTLDENGLREVFENMVESIMNNINHTDLSLKDKFAKILKELKENNVEDVEVTYNGHQIKVGEICSKVKNLCDTCYDEAKAKKLYNALKNAFGNDPNEIKNGALLLAAAYTDMLKGDEKAFRVAEALVAAIRARAYNEDSNVYLPFCPSTGDVIALLYLYLLP